ncbi:MAG: class I SAM-dependent methyltransferase [Acidobacteria bacterium]|nr:class I SAM-dependent methyltransferase [Acidobacteriota bacterium]
MDVLTSQKWDRAARSYDLMNGYGQEVRWAPFKRRLFERMRGRIIFASIGTGQDIQFFPPGRDITGIDISSGMLERARPRAAAYTGRLELRQVDLHDLDYPDGAFDQAFTACTFCSVPRPVEGLRMLRRVLKPGGELFMFEHTGSRYFPFNLMLNLMTPLSRRFGPEMNRNTVANVTRAGFEIHAVEPVYLDVVKMIRAAAPGASGSR